MWILERQLHVASEVSAFFAGLAVEGGIWPLVKEQILKFSWIGKLPTFCQVGVNMTIGSC